MNSYRTEWELAAETIGRELGVNDVSDFVVRADVARDGGSIWTLEVGGEMRWYSCRGSEIQRLIPAHDAKLPGASLLDSYRILSWRPARRAVALERAGNRVWKFTRSSRATETLSRCSAGLAHLERAGGFSSPAIVATDAGFGAFAAEFVEGRPLEVRRADVGRWRKVGRGLRMLSELKVDDSLVWRHTKKDELAHLHLRRGVVANFKGGIDEKLVELLGQLEVVGDDLIEVELRAAHRDLHDGQILCDGDVLWLLDLDLFSAANPALDIANLSAHVVLRGLQGRAASDDDAKAVSLGLMQGFDPPDDQSFHFALRFYQAATFARLALLYSLRPRWTQLVPQLVAHGAAALREVGRA